MDAYSRLRASATAMIVRDFPRQFWVDLRALSVVVYADVFAEVKADKGIHPDQKIDDLLQRRHFKMEKLIADLAELHGLSCSLTVIAQNNRRHAYVYHGDVAVTQSYVQAIGAMPQPARFREKLANTMSIPRLDLGDEPPGAFIMRNLYGVIAHNPLGRRFHPDDQKARDDPTLHSCCRLQYVGSRTRGRRISGVLSCGHRARSPGAFSYVEEAERRQGHRIR